MHKILILAAVLAMMAAPANAAAVGFVEIAHEVDIEGSLFNVWEMQVTTETDWTNARLDVDLWSGEMYAHPLGGITEPIQSQKDAIDDLEYHTWLTVPGGGGEVDVPIVLAGEIIMPTAGGQRTRIGASWGNTDTTDIGTFSIAQITLSTDAEGWLELICFDVETEGLGAGFRSSIGEPIGQIGRPYPFAGMGGMGDANLDGVVDDLDLSLLLAHWNQDSTGDCDGGWGMGEFDGVAPVQDNDLALLLLNWTAKARWMTDPPGEISGTPPVDDTDLALLLDAWGQDASFTPPESMVGDEHLSILLVNWATGGPDSIGIPEPATLALLAAGAVVLIRRRR